MKVHPTRRGLALLEVLVALILLSLVVVAYLRLFQGSHQLFSRSRDWSEAAAHAADGMERAKLELPGLPSEGEDELPGGFRRRVTAAPWQPGLALIQVSVELPGGGRLDVYRLGRAEKPSGAAR